MMLGRMKERLQKFDFSSASLVIIFLIMAMVPVVADSVEGLTDTTVQYHNWKFTPNEMQESLMDQYWGKDMTIGDLLEKIAPDEFNRMDDLLKIHAYEVKVNWDPREYDGQRNPYELMMGVTTAYSRVYDADTAPPGTPEILISSSEGAGVPCPIEEEQEPSVSLQGSFQSAAPVLEFVPMDLVPSRSMEVKTRSTSELPGVSAYMRETSPSILNQKGFAVNGLEMGSSTEVYYSMGLSFLTNEASSLSGDSFPSNGFVPVGGYLNDWHSEV